MRKFRMLTATALIGAMVFGVTACGQPTPTTVTTEPTTTVTETETTPSETTVETTKENPLVAQILDFCSVWRTRAELKERFNHLTSSYLMSYFVNPMVSQGRIELKSPDKPRSKNQEYRTV